MQLRARGSLDKGIQSVRGTNGAEEVTEQVNGIHQRRGRFRGGETSDNDSSFELVVLQCLKETLHLRIRLRGGGVS